MSLRINDPQAKLDGFFPEYEHLPPSSFQDVLEILDEKTKNKTEKGDVFEQLVKAFLEEDKAQSKRFDRLWMWSDWPGNNGEHGTGVDIVARERDSGDLVAIQCKFYSPSRTIGLTELNKFLARYSTTPFSSGIFVSTSWKWGKNAENSRLKRDKPVTRWGPDIFENSSIDWKNFSLTRPNALIQRETKKIRDYQHLALEDTLEGFKTHDRGKLIMACGTGKTFTALRIAERQAGPGKTILFLTPSISLLSQSLLDWANDADIPLKLFAVCSDTRAGRRAGDYEDISHYDLAYPATTDATKLKSRLDLTDRSGDMTVIFSTYQSLDVIADAQKTGLAKIDLVICDEAHRTTGVSLVGNDSESNFQRVHNNGFISADKRLYMTATPRIYGDRTKRKANENLLTIASMDDETKYGPEFHRLGFGQASEMGILSPYKVVIFNVDMEQVGIDLDEYLSDESSPVNMSNAASMVGCWNGLGKRGASGFDFSTDPLPARRAVAFSNRIDESELFETHFPRIVESCISAAGENAENPLECQVHHVDGTQNALERANHLAWLRQEPDPGTCKILTNARCLTEGIDVPALDAILFLHPRRSEIDVVQAVGRVMRKAEGKNFGYIILPIAQAPNASAEDTLRSSAYKAVWQVINAISAHDDRFEAQINQLALVKPSQRTEWTEGGSIGGGGIIDGGEVTPDDTGVQGTLPLIIAGPVELRDAILARIVNKYADPGYWEKWATDVRGIAERHEARIRALLNRPNSDVRPIFDGFLGGLRQNLNDGITEDDAIGMLSQHLVTKPVFDALFEDYTFAQSNPVSQAMEGTLKSLQERGLEKETEGLENFYRDIRVCVRGVTDAASKQRIIAELYQRFFKLALPDTASKLGIVYTPVEVVDYIIRSVEDLLKEKFGSSLSNEGVHVLDPFVGTGTFITRLMRSGIVGTEDLTRKYEKELHANDIMLLAYYIAAINIESTYHDLVQAEEYHLFNGIVLTDTFQSYEEADPMDEFLFPRNNERIERQKGLDIRVIIGNPPWPATNNRNYQTIDQKVKETYAEKSGTGHLSALYDPYVKAIRLASDRIQEGQNGGIVAFVTNGGFIDSNSFDGFRKAVVEEFNEIYCFNLRGDQRTSGEKSRQEGGKVFGQESRASVAILLMVKKPEESDGATIHYRDIGNYLDRDEKLAILRDSRLSDTEWSIIEPNEAGDWVNQRSEAFTALRPLAPPEEKVEGNDLEPIFKEEALGLQTGRDAWCYNSSLHKLTGHIQSSIAFYNQQVEDFLKTNPSGSAQQRNAKALAFAKQDPRQFHWREEVNRDLANGRKFDWKKEDFVQSSYRPFFKQYLYFNRNLNCRPRTFAEIFPKQGNENTGISIVSRGSQNLFHALVTDGIPDSELTSHTVYYPRWRYNPSQALTNPPEPEVPELKRVSNINPKALAQFREHYSDDKISEDDLFYYAYGILHTQQWRDTFADDLTKSAARIPMAATADDFRAFAAAGRELADLHVNYETVEPYPLEEILAPGWNPDAPDAYSVEKMAYAGPARNPDRTAIVCNAHITLTGIPEQAHEYRLGSRSALDWLIDRYQVKADGKSGITNDPNDWATEHGQPRYIIDLIKRITTVSVRTVEIVQGLPALPLEGTEATDAQPLQKWEFQILADEWERERPRGVDIAEMVKHPAYQRIIEIGEPAVGWLLERLAEKPGHWFPALNRITGPNPVPEESQGKLKEMTEAWLSWGKLNGYEW